MARPQLNALTDQEYQNFKRIERAFLLDSPQTVESVDLRLASGPGLIAVCLLDDLPSGETCLAAVLRRGTNTARQFVDIVGASSDDDTFRIEWAPDPTKPSETETIEDLPANMTADEFREQLETLPSIDPGDVDVQLGRHNRIFRAALTETVNLRRWIVEFRGKYEGKAVSLLEASVIRSIKLASFGTSQETFLYDTGETEEIYAPVPVGNPSPMRRGAIGVCGWGDGLGWTLVALEARAINLVETYGGY